MNSKVTTNSQLLTTELNKQKLRKPEQEWNRITEMEITWRVISGGGETGEWWERYRE